MEKDMLYRLALTRVYGIGAVHARALFNCFGDAETIFRTSPAVLAKIRGIGSVKAAAIAGFNNFRSVEKELVFLERYRIRALFFTDKDYPQRLADHPNAPVLLFFRGPADLNASRIVGIAGTRAPTGYGRQAIDEFLGELSDAGLLVVSGLAYGIDAASHKAAIKHGIPTVGVLGHGLDRIYPQLHTSLAREMARQGGLLTEFGLQTEPEEYNFPVRNRIIAALSDALIVVETACRGGSMLTVKNATDYGRKIFAFPGRINDPKSAGCNALIREGKAILLSSPGQFLEDMRWQGQRPRSRQQESSKEEESLHEEEKVLLSLLRTAGKLSLDELLLSSGLPLRVVPLALLNLELRGCIHSLPGKTYAAGS